MTEHPSSAFEEAANLLRQAKTTLTHVRGNAGWPTITTQMNMGTTTSVCLLTGRGTQFDAVSFIGMIIWVLTSLILVIAFAEVAKNGFGIRWGVCITIWALYWSISISFPTAAVRVLFAAVIAVTSFIDALMEAH